MKSFKNLPKKMGLINHTNFFGSKISCKHKLSSEEKSRLDSLLSSARWFHYAAFTLSGMALVISFIDHKSEFTLPLGNISIPPIEASVFLHYLVLIFSVFADRSFVLSKKWFIFDDRRIPFPWIVFYSSQPSIGLVRFWLLLPIVISAFATGNSFAGDPGEGYSLSFFSVLFWFWSRDVFQKYDIILSKKDIRGGAVTYSMWLLYWFYLYRSIIIAVFFATPIILLLPKVDLEISFFVISLGIAIFPVQIIRWICSTQKVYRYIDKQGTSQGFIEKSPHYK